jgi:hypothetical protein
MNCNFLLFNHSIEVFDKYPFEVFYARAKHRAKRIGKKFNLEVIDLREQWRSQKGICPISGYELILPKRGKRAPFLPMNASLDRIKNSGGYERSNIQFVALAIQFAKNAWSDEIIRDFFSRANWEIQVDN